MDSLEKMVWTPYVLHPIRCSKIAADVYNNENRELEILMLTHDVVEDCKIPISEIKSQF